MAVINSITVGDDTYTVGGWGEPGVYGYTPIGTIIAVMANTAPAHYLACDGSIVNIEDYPELADFFLDQFGSVNYFGGDGEATFAVPDLRGEFLRGTGTNSHASSGNGANVGIHQAPTFIPYFNGGYLTASSASKNSMTIGFNSSSTTGTYNSIENADSSLSGSGYRKYGSFTADVSSTSTSGYIYKQAIRPTNTSVLFCIATKNIYTNPENSYSTDEKVVGRWVDGKTLYQKTIPITLPNVVTEGTNVSVNVAHNISNIDIAFVVNAFVLDPDFPTSSTFTVAGSFFALNSGSQIKFRIGRVNIQIESGAKNYNGCTGYLTVQYTKTSESNSE